MAPTIKPKKPSKINSQSKWSQRGQWAGTFYGPLLVPGDYAKTPIQMKSFTILFSFGNTTPHWQTPFCRLNSARVSWLVSRGFRLSQFFKCTAQNKLCSELGRRCGQTRNKTDERDSRCERDGDSRSSPGAPLPRRRRSTWRRPRELSSRFIVTYTSPKICLPLKSSFSQSYQLFLDT